MKLKFSDKEFVIAVETSFSIREVLNKLGIVPAGGNYKIFHQKVKRLGIDTSHFTGQGYLKYKTHNWAIKQPIEEILIKNSAYTSSYSLKHRLLKEQLMINQCAICLIAEWNSKPLALHLDHIDGDNTNNELLNLRLLCPNCHSQTETYCGKNKGKNSRLGGTRTHT